MRERLDEAAALPGWIHVPLNGRRGESDNARGESPGGKKGSSLPIDSALGRRCHGLSRVIKCKALCISGRSTNELEK